MNANVKKNASGTVAPGAKETAKPDSDGIPETRKSNASEILMKHHEKFQWVYWTIVLLGLWLILSPLNYDYKSSFSVLPKGRSLWISDTARGEIFFWSDILSGFVLVIFGYLSLRPSRPVYLWIVCFAGVWLNAAPLIFWAPSPFIYFNDTLTGILAVSMSILIPGMPNMAAFMQMGPEIPPGWSYNPSSWAQRSILILLGFGGFIISRYLAAYQFGFIQNVWEPFFGQGSLKVLTSKISESLPVSDAGLGAFAYTFEFLMGWMGGAARWRTMPWMVTVFGILVVPLGLVHIFLVISQPVTVGSWCFMCLMAALCMLPMIPLEIDEVFAMIQFLRVSKRNGKPAWNTFWKGGTIDAGGQDNASPQPIEFSIHPVKTFKASLWGMSFSWTLIVSALLGLFVVSEPGILGNIRLLSDVEHLSGALTITFSVLAMGEAIRPVRFLNILLGLVLAAFSLFVSGVASGRLSLNMVVAAAIIVLSIPKGKIKESYGSWDKYIK